MNMHCSVLPVNGVPSGIMTVESDTNIMSNEITSPDLGSTTDNGEEDTIYNQTSEMSSFMPVNEQQLQDVETIKDKLCPNEPVNWATVTNQPINEYQIPFLARLAFPTLFPDGKGDPTNPSLLNEIPIGERVKHLIKFAETIDGKWVYRFSSHLRFSYWAFNMIQRKRTLQQSGIFLKQNPGDAHLTIDELCAMAASNNSNAFISKISRYVAG